MDNKTLEQKANYIRQTILTMIYNGGSGHPGGSMSAADICTYLYFQEMNVTKENYTSHERDRFVLSKGHAAPCLYATLAERGVLSKDVLKSFRKIGGTLQGHPDMKHTPGVDMSTGSLGQGVSAAVGMALAGKLKNSSARTYVLIGDGELQEGQVWEAIMFAAHRKLDNLTFIVDNNDLQIDGKLPEVNSPYPIDQKFQAFNVYTVLADGHDFSSLANAFIEARSTHGSPTAVIANTVKGKGVSFMEDQAGWHGKAPTDEEYQMALAELTKAGEAYE